MARTDPPKPLVIAFTVDVDPDANRAVAGRPDAVGPDGEARCDACRRGLAIVRAGTSRRHLPVTLFWEGRSLREIAGDDPDLVAAFADDPLSEHGGHGYLHEDYAGAVSGRALTRDEVEASLDAAEEAFADVLRRRPAGFRAPYCRMTGDLAAALADRSYTHDASITVEAPAESRLRPFRLPEAPSVWELPLCRGRDARGRPVSGYLWQLFEGRRPVGDYTAMAAAMRESCAGGLLQIALHPWHLLISEDGGPPAADCGGGPADRLETLIEQLTALDGVEFATLSGYLESHSAGAEGAGTADDDPL